MDEGPEDWTPPEGFVLSEGRGPFTSHNGPLYHAPTVEGARQGFRVVKRHCNGLGIVHGGMLASFIDGLLGHAVGRAARNPAVTVHLSLDYLSMGRAGDWIEGEARVDRLAGDLAFAQARAFVGERDVIRATAVFKVLERRRN